MAKKEQQEEIRVPLNSDLLAEIDYDRAQIAVAMRNLQECAERFARNALKLDDYEAAELGVSVQVRNIRNTSSEVVNYVCILKMLSEHLAIDMQTIYVQQKAYKQRILLELAAAEQRAAEQRKKENDARIAQAKRDAEKAAKAENNNN